MEDTPSKKHEKTFSFNDQSGMFKILEHLCFKCGKVVAKTVFFDPSLTGWNGDRLLCGQCDDGKDYYSSRSSIVFSDDLSNHFNANITEKSCVKSRRYNLTDPTNEKDNIDATFASPREFQKGVRESEDPPAVQLSITRRDDRESHPRESEDPAAAQVFKSNSVNLNQESLNGENAKNGGARKSWPEEMFKKLPNRRMRCLKCGDSVDGSRSCLISHEARCVKNKVFKCIICQNPATYFHLTSLQKHIRYVHKETEIPTANWNEVEKYLVQVPVNPDGQYFELGSKNKCGKCGSAVPKQFWGEHKCWAEGHLERLDEVASGWASNKVAHDFEQVFITCDPSDKAADENGKELEKGNDDLDSGEERFEEVSKTSVKCMKCLKTFCKDDRQKLDHEFSCWRGSVFKCIFCPDVKEFSRYGNLRKHIKIVHKDKETPKTNRESIKDYLARMQSGKDVQDVNPDKIAVFEETNNEPLTRDGLQVERLKRKSSTSENVDNRHAEEIFEKITSEKFKCLKCAQIVGKKSVFDHKVSCWRGMMFKCIFCEKLVIYFTLKSLQEHLKNAHEVTEIPIANSPALEKYLANVEAGEDERYIDLGNKFKCFGCGTTVLKQSWQSHEAKCWSNDTPGTSSRKRSFNRELSGRDSAGEAVTQFEEVFVTCNPPNKVSRLSILKNGNQTSKMQNGQGNFEKRFKKLPQGKVRCLNCRKRLGNSLKKRLSHEVWCWRGMIFKCTVCEDPKIFYGLDSLCNHFKVFHKGSENIQISRAGIEKYVSKVEKSRDGRFIEMGDKVKCTGCGAVTLKKKWPNHEERCFRSSIKPGNQQSLGGTVEGAAMGPVDEFSPEIKEVFGNLNSLDDFEDSPVPPEVLPIVKEDSVTQEADSLECN